MYKNSLRSLLHMHLGNLFGWKSERRIVIIESDDWGSIRMSSQSAFKNLLNAGMKENLNHYNVYDALECNDDLVGLFETLSKFKDITGRHPVLTGVNVVANPDFEKIKESNYTKYIWEPYTETLKRYPNHDKVYDLWKQGILNRLFVPTFHGREHLHTQRWLRALQSGNQSTLLAFENEITGIYNGISGEKIPDFQAAFDLDLPSDLDYMNEVLKTGLALFESLYGYKSTYFVPTNGPFNNSLEKTLAESGVKYVNTGKVQNEPRGNNKYKKNIRFIGQKNNLGQIYLTRNCFFEPSSSGFECPANTDWIDNCLKEIEIAFKWNKPATISSHRVNYIGFLHAENRTKNLKLLEELLLKIIKKWPDVEFMTSMELGDVINLDLNKKL